MCLYAKVCAYIQRTWNFPYSFNGAIFSIMDLLKIVACISINNPNTLILGSHWKPLQSFSYNILAHLTNVGDDPFKFFLRMSQICFVKLVVSWDNFSHRCKKQRERQKTALFHVECWPKHIVFTWRTIWKHTD